MDVKYFKDQQRESQIEWRKRNIKTRDYGWHNKRAYPHIIPLNQWEETLWGGIRNDLKPYLVDKNIQKHSGTHNLLSSWVVCANLYFIIRNDNTFRNLMLGFLQKNISNEIIEITDVELEFSFNGQLSPEKLLGEKNGFRGSGQTSPDVAFLVKTKKGKGIILTECKYTEHSFYHCSGRRTVGSDKKPANPDPSRCMQIPIGDNYIPLCHQVVWGRRYWDYLKLSEHGKKVLRRCPAATSGYQLFRQHALAEGIAEKGDFDLVVSSVAYDQRNKALINSLKSTGVNNFATDWETIFSGNTIFKAWTHQEWVEYVRKNASGSFQSDWLSYVNRRYGY